MGRIKGYRKPYQKLAAGVMARAYKDICQGDLDALFWLTTPSALFICEALGLPHPLKPLINGGKGLEVMREAIEDAKRH